MASRAAYADTSAQAIPTGPKTEGGKEVAVVLNLLIGVAFLSWNQHPEPTGSRRATPPLHFARLSASDSICASLCALTHREGSHENPVHDRSWNFGSTNA
jgi:hypothetical protein